MENLSLNIQNALQLLIYSSIIMFVIITVFLIKLLIDLSSLTKTLQNIVIVVKHDLGPTLKEFKRALININSIVNKTDDQFSDINKTIGATIKSFSGTTLDMTHKAGFALCALKKGLSAGMKVFFEQKRTK